MSNFLEKRNGDGKAVSPEKQRMMDALARLGSSEARQVSARPASTPAQQAPRMVGEKAPCPAPADPPPARLRKPGRLVVALDLTASREHSIGQARVATAGMFDTIKSFGSLLVKFIYFRGQFECVATEWHDDPDALSKSMKRLDCECGVTQIARMLDIVLAESELLAGVVYVGDHCEEDEGELIELAAACGRKSIPLFMFHECGLLDRRADEAKGVFKQMAEASSGAYLKFNKNAEKALKDILATIGAFAAAGVEGVKQLPPSETPQGRELQGRLLLAAPDTPANAAVKFRK